MEAALESVVRVYEKNKNKKKLKKKPQGCKAPPVWDWGLSDKKKRKKFCTSGNHMFSLTLA